MYIFIGYGQDRIFFQYIKLGKLKNISFIQQFRFLLIIELSPTTKAQLVNNSHAVLNIEKYD